MATANGQTIGSSLSFDEAAHFPATSEPTLYGFRFDSFEGLFYGWASISTAGEPGPSLTVHEWAIENSAGTSILAGATTSAVPEPAEFAFGLGALALGAAAVGRRRRREKAEATAAV